MAWQDRSYNREDGAMEMRLGFQPPTPAAVSIIIACIAAFILQAMTGHKLEAWTVLVYNHGLMFRQPWRLVTFQYLHASAFEIFFNIIGIYFFVCPLERVWGTRKTFIFYSLGGVVSALCFAVIGVIMHPGDVVPFILFGAGGGVMTVLGACALLFPDMRLAVLFVFMMPIRLVAILWALLFLLMVVGEHNVAQAALLGGLVFGFLAPYYGRGLAHNWTRRFQQHRTRRRIENARLEQALVDRILAKVHDSGMHSLTRIERRILSRATIHQRQRDRQLADSRQHR